MARQEERHGVTYSPNDNTYGSSLHLLDLRPLDKPLDESSDDAVDDESVKAHGTVIAPQAYDVHEWHDGSASDIVRIPEQRLAIRVSDHVPSSRRTVHFSVVSLFDLA